MCVISLIQYSVLSTYIESSGLLNQGLSGSYVQIPHTTTLYNVSQTLLQGTLNGIGTRISFH